MRTAPKMVLIALLSALAVVPSARAEDVAAAREHYRKAALLYDTARYAEAAREFTLALEAKDDAALLYNIGQAHRMAGNPQEAVAAYRGYLRRVPNARNRVEVEGRIRDLQETIDKQRAGEEQERQAAEQRRLEAERRAPAAAAPAAPAQAVPMAEAATAPKPSTPVYKKWWLWTVVGVAVVGVGLGVGLGLGLNRDGFDPSLGRVGPGALTGGAL